MAIRLIFRRIWYCVLLVGVVSTWTSPGHGQLLEELSKLLQPPQPVEVSSEELPAPQESNQTDSSASILEPPEEPFATGTPEGDSGPTVTAEPSGDSRDQIYLGLEAEELTDGIPGLRVASVSRDSPAWKAGFQEGDRIIGINGHSVSKMNDMVQRMSTTKPGQTVSFLISRSGRTLELTAVLISMSMAEQMFGQPWESGDEAAWLGLVLHDLTPSFREQFGISAFRGAAVSQVAKDSPGQRAGIRAGDAITEVDGNAIESASDVLRWLQTVRPGDQVSLVIYRGVTRIPVQTVLSSEPRPQPSPPSFRPPSLRPPMTGAGSARRTPPPPPEPTPPGRASRPSSGRQIEVPFVPPPNASLHSEKTTREIELESEVERLRQELADAQSKLAETREQLNNILRALRD